MEQFNVHGSCSFHYLGADIPYHFPNNIDKSNYLQNTFASNFPYIRNVLSPCNTPHHTLLGWLLFVRAFVGSKLAYSFSMNPSPLATVHNTIQQLLNHYIWSQGHHHLTAKLLYQPWDAGWFHMYCSLHQEHAVKLKWFNRLMQQSSMFWQCHIAYCFHFPCSKLAYFNGTCINMMRLCKKNKVLPMIWRDIL